ncbi:MAG: hypothetical protein KJ950_00420 [Proteobacteria bacterium]|nr:hypothetical protein [Pseudomonadota bacterium]MBU1685817.1 hypothetical protein [Pseudomonadota bacterium]
MGHKHNKKQRHEKVHETRRPPVKGGSEVVQEPPRLEIVLKADSDGSRGAVAAEINRISAEIPVGVIHSGVGDITQSDLFFAETASRLVIGFGVDLVSGVRAGVEQSGVEVRLYRLIYPLAEDLKRIAASLVPKGESETVIGQAKVIALFKSCRHGSILGCELVAGRLALGDHFRVISGMGPIYSGRIKSLQIGDRAVDQAGVGRQVGLKIEDFNRGAIGDLVESYRPIQPPIPWRPDPGVCQF